MFEKFQMCVFLNLVAHATPINIFAKFTASIITNNKSS